MSMQMNATQQTVSSSPRSGTAVPDLNRIFTLTPQVYLDCIHNELYHSTVE